MLKLEFQDCRVCVKCGAPAERIGDHWQSDDGERHFRAYSVANGRRGVFTHVCTRNNGEDAQGARSSDDQHRYACGALRDIDTRRVAAEQMWRRCHIGDDLDFAPDINAEWERVRDAAGERR